MAQITRFDASQFPTTFAAQIKDFDNEGCVLRYLSRASMKPKRVASKRLACGALRNWL